MRELVLRNEAVKPVSQGKMGEARPQVMALDYLRSVYRDPLQPDSVRMRAAMACLQFENPKLAVTASVSDPAFFAERLERAIRRSGISLTIDHAPQPRPDPPKSDVTGPMLGTSNKMRRL
jgi:hypothetical protein